MPVANTSARTLTDLLFERAGVGLCLVAPDGSVVRANPEWLRSTGFTEEQVVGESIIELFPATRDMALAMHARAREGHHVEVPRHAQRVQDRETWWEGSIDPVPMDDGVGLLVTAREVGLAGVADHRRTEQALRETEERFRLLTEAMTQIVCVLGLDGAPEYVNQAWTGFSGLDLAATRRAGWEGLVHRDDLGRARACRRLALESRRPQEVELRYRASDGTYHWFLSRLVPVVEGERVVRLVGAGVEIEHLKRAEAAVREREERLRLLIAHTPAAVAMFDRDMRYLAVSRRFLSDYRLGGQDVIGRQHYEVFPEIPEHWKEIHRRCLAGAVERSEEEPFLRADGSTDWIRWEIVPWRDAAGEVGGIVLFSEDISERKRVEEALRAREAQFTALIEELHSGVALIDATGRFTLYNRRFLQMFGLSRNADVGNVNSQDWTAWQVFDQDGRLLALDDHPVRKAALTRRPVRGQLVAVRLPSATELRWMVVSAEPILAQDGSLAQIICTYHDLTDRVRAEEALRDSEGRFRALFDQMSLGCFLAEIICDDGGRPVDYRYLEVNAAFECLTGLRPADVVGHTVLEILPGVEKEWIEQYGRVALTGEPASLQRYAQPLGRHYETRAYSPRPGQFACLFSDVTEQRRAAEALRQSESRLRRYADLVEHAPVLVRTLAGEVIVWNRGMQSLYGWTRDEVLGKVGHEVLRTRFPEPLEALGAKVLREGRWEGELVHQHRDGGEIVVASVWVLHRDEDGQPSAIVEVNHDITELKRVQQALREADRRKDEFLGMLSHELRNPLAPIRNSSYILRHAPAASEQARRAQDVIERQTEHLTRLVDDLLDVTRITRGKIELRRSRVDLRDVVSRAADDFRLTMHDRGVLFEVVIPDEKLWADADATRITQVVGNLLHNASKFTRRGDEVKLSMERKGGWAEIRLLDTGAGIDAKLLPTIFEPFVQGELTLARTEGGLGLGLALVKGITELHGGAVGAESAGRGKGSQFTVRLPLADAVELEAPPDRRVERRRGARRVLIVDDNADAAESLAEIVRLLGHEVDVAYDGPTALEKVRANAPQLVLCDIGLPGMSGYEVARAVRTGIGEGMRLIAVSGYAQPEDVKRAVEAGFDGHLAKPCDPDQIARLLG